MNDPNITLCLLLMSAFLLGAAVTLVAVALGGFLVFKSKREAHERLFSSGPLQGNAFVVDQVQLDEEDEKEDPDAVPGILQRKSDAFVDQYMRDKLAGLPRMDPERAN